MATASSTHRFLAEAHLEIINDIGYAEALALMIMRTFLTKARRLLALLLGACVFANPGGPGTPDQTSAKNASCLGTPHTDATAPWTKTQALAERPLSIPMRRFTVTLGQLYRMALPVPSHFRLSHAALIAPLIVLISPTLAQAQSEWNVGFGASIANPTLIGTVTRRPLQFVTLGAGWTMHDGRIVQIKWTPEIMPFLALSEPHENFFTFITPNSSRNSPQPPGYFFHVDQGPRTIYGGGVSPLSWTFVFFPKHRLVFSLGFKAGIVETAAAVPYQGPIGTAFNYHLGANAEVGWKLPNGTRVAIGAADEHMSNGHVSNGMQKIPVDPGMDFMEFYFRVYIPWKHKGKHPHVTLDR